MFSRRAKVTVITSIAVTAIVLSALPFIFTAPLTHKQSTSDTTNIQDHIESEKIFQPLQRGPPDTLTLSFWGKQDTLEHAKSLPDMSWVSLPTYIPDNLTLAPIRVKSDNYTTIITAIYAPAGIDTSDNVTNEQAASAGGFSISYWKQIGNEPGLNLTKNIQGIAKENPDSVSLDTINGHLTDVSLNDMQIDAGPCKDEANCWLMIDVASTTYNSTKLMPIAKSITILP